MLFVLKLILVMVLLLVFLIVMMVLSLKVLWVIWLFGCRWMIGWLLGECTLGCWVSCVMVGVDDDCIVEVLRWC